MAPVNRSADTSGGDPSESGFSDAETIRFSGDLSSEGEVSPEEAVRQRRMAYGLSPEVGGPLPKTSESDDGKTRRLGGDRSEQSDFQEYTIPVGSAVSSSVSGPLNGELSSNATGNLSKSHSTGSSFAQSGSLSGGIEGKTSGSSSGDDSIPTRRKASGRTDSEERLLKIKRENRKKRLKVTLIAVVALALVLSIASFWLLRWGLNDDVSDFQGSWRIQGTDSQVEITDSHIELTDGVSYGYVMNPEAKTLSFNFGGLSGTGRYRFSLDRNQLAIQDGNFDWFSTLGGDMPWLANAIWVEITSGKSANPGFGEGEMVLERIR